MQGKSQKNATQVDNSQHGNDAETAFERQLLNKIRNFQKKIKQIEELEQKAKSKDFNLNEDQRKKIAEKPRFQDQIDEVKSYLELYQKNDKKERMDSEKKMTQRHEKELKKVQMSAFNSFANMITLYSILNSGGELPDSVDNADSIQSGVEHFSKSLLSLMNFEGGKFQWRQEMDHFHKSWSKLITGGKDNVPSTDMSYEAMNQACGDLVKQGNFPATIEVKVKEEPPAVQEQSKTEQVQEEEEAGVPEDAAFLAAGFDDAFASDSEDVAPPQKQADPAIEKIEQPVENQPEAEEQPAEEVHEKQEEQKVEEDEGEQSGKQDRNNRDNRGGFQRRQRGDRGGQDGDDRGGFRRNKNNRGNRPNTGYKKGNEDDEGFNVVQDKSDNRGRRRGGRGRGNYRGDRGDRGGDRGGERSGRGDRGRGNRGNRGDRPPRKQGDQTGNGAAERPAGQNDAPAQVNDNAVE